MRIIAGKYKGRRLDAPRGSRTRPTTDKVREAVFDLLESRIAMVDTRVLDLFCGSGAFGLEAISRGSAGVVFVDLDRNALRAAAANAKTLGVDNQCRFLQREGIRYLAGQASSTFDLILADPPYGFSKINEVPNLATCLLNVGGILVLEHTATHRFENLATEMESRSYGRTIVSIFRAPSQSNANQAETT